MTRVILIIVVCAAIAGFAAAQVLRAYTGFQYAAPGATYTLYRGEGIRDRSDVRNYVATFNGGSRETNSNLAACEKVQRLLQDRASPPLVYWCEVGGYHP